MAEVKVFMNQKSRIQTPEFRTDSDANFGLPIILIAGAEDPGGRDSFGAHDDIK